MVTEQAIFHRAELLLGQETMARIAETRVIIFGVGGVGSWCAEDGPDAYKSSGILEDSRRPLGASHTKEIQAQRHLSRAKIPLYLFRRTT